MGSFVSSQQDVADPKTGLTPREKGLVRDTWALVRKDVKANAIAIFLTLFQRHPEYQKLFSGFADVPYEALSTNPRLGAHAMSVAYAITSLVDSLDDADCLVELVRKIAISHTRRPVTVTNFEHTMAVIVDTLKERLGSKMTPSAVAAWEKTLRLVVTVTADVYGEVQRK